MARFAFSKIERDRRRGRNKSAYEAAKRQRRARSGAAPVDKRSRLAFWLLVALFVVVLAGGGASRTDVYSLLYLRPLTALVLAVLLVMVRPSELTRVRVPLILLGCLAGWIALQLVPLPPDLWLALPGRARFAEAAAIAGIDQPWRPLTLTPDLAWNSLLALVPAFAALIGYAMVGERHRRATVPLLIAGATASMLVAILQVTGGATSPAYLYEVTHAGSAVGLFSNRNHQAAFLATTFVVLRVWALAPAVSRERTQLKNGVAIVFAIALVPLIFVTGSRAGLVLALAALAAALLVRPPALSTRAPSGKYRLLVAGVGALFLAAIVYMVLFSSRSLALRRLGGLEVESDVRFRNMNVVLEIIRDFLPFGAGFGSFDKVFRIYEPDRWLGPTYYNRAHNDLFELVLTGGVPALVLLVAFLAWLVSRGVALVRAPAEGAEQAHYRARGGLAVIVLVLLASLVDYPLRTPLMTTVFALAVGWVAVHQATQRRSSDPSAQQGASPSGL